MQRSMSASNVNLVPLSAEDKPLLLRKLQGSIHFEKTLTATTAPGDDKQYSKLTLPARFIRKHGDKFEKTVILRTESSTKPWRVNLLIWHHSPTSTQVRFGGGWQAFAISNGLLEGDVLIFVLTAMSEFKVYVFRSSEGQNQNPTRKRRRWTYDSDHSQEKAERPYRRCRDAARLRADEEGSDEGKNGGKNCARRKSSTVYDSATAPIPSILQERQFATPSELREDINNHQCQSECRSCLGVSSGLLK